MAKYVFFAAYRVEVSDINTLRISRKSNMNSQIEAESLLEATKIMVDKVKLNCKTDIKEIKKNVSFSVNEEWEITVFEYLGKEDD